MMKCPKCESTNTVTNKYMRGENAFGRTYKCRQCGHEFTTVEMYTEHAQKLLHSGKFDWEAVQRESCT